MRTIRVTGTGRIKARPDTTRLTMTLSGLLGDYAESLRRSAEETEELRELFSGLGFERTALKTLRFDVDAEYESCRDSNGDYKQRFAGYRFHHVLKLEFPSDNERLGRILYELGGSAASPEIRIGYTLGDPEAAKNLLLGRAVADARAKAAALTQAGGAVLGELQSIDYSWGELDFEVRPGNGEILCGECSYIPAGRLDLDMEPDDIEASDTVTVVWALA